MIIRLKHTVCVIMIIVSWKPFVYLNIFTHGIKEKLTTGTLSGWVKSENELVDVLNEPKFTYIEGTDDQWLAIEWSYR